YWEKSLEFSTFNRLASSLIFIYSFRNFISTSILKTHYRRGATILTPGQIEEIRHLKNKVPVYMIVNEYHINKDDFERSQQNRNHFFEELRKAQSISSENGSEVHAKQPCEASN
ncbi:11530_t:CDS:1, partial [Dentiscutata erythropus]